MKYVRWSPRVNHTHWLREFDRYVDRQLERPSWHADADLGLAVDVSENDESYIVKASVPGVNPDEVEITFEEDVLTIKGEFTKDGEVEEENYHIRERQYGSFGRRLRFPVNVNVEAIEATYENGILKLNVPKAEEVKPKRIAVKAG